MTKGWYNHVATTQGGYVQTWSSTKEGRSGEDAFSERLHALLEAHQTVLDAGCGSGEFALALASRVRHVVGFDYAEKMVEAAWANAVLGGQPNVTFVQSDARSFAWEPEAFDIIYSRRGPTSILLRPELLRPGGWLLGVHSGNLEAIRERLDASGLEAVELETFETLERFPTREDFAKFWSRMPGHPDYLSAEHAAELDELAAQHRDGHGLVVLEWRVVWRARKGSS
jgi:SAM-dependent methyltransferase